MGDIGSMEMSEFMRVMEKPKNPPFSAAIVLGQGPILETSTKRKAEDVAKENGSRNMEEINSWGRTIAVATGYLKEKGEFSDVYFTGGKKDVSDTALVKTSEADEMSAGAKKVFGENFMEGDKEDLDREATNLLENLVNVANMQYEKGTTAGKLLFICSHYQVSRTETLLRLFGYDMKNVTILSAEEVVKVMAQDPNVSRDEVNNAAVYLTQGEVRSYEPRVPLQKWIEKRIDVTDQSFREYFPDDRLFNSRMQEGQWMEGQRSYVGGGNSIDERTVAFTPFEKAYSANKEFGNQEARTYQSRLWSENMLSQALLRVPAYWVKYLGQISDPMMVLRSIKTVEKLNPGFFQDENVGISGDMMKAWGIDKDLSQYNEVPLEELQNLIKPFKDKVKDVARKFPSATKDPWSKETIELNEGLLNI